MPSEFEKNIQNLTTPLPGDTPCSIHYKLSVKQKYEGLRNIAYDNLKIHSSKPEAGYYLFFSLKPYLKNKTFNELFEEILNTGVALTPGVSFGKDFTGYARLCFTSVEEDKLVKGIELLNGVLQRRYD